MLPSISDVSTVEEWRSVAGNIVQRASKINWRAVIVDWPGLGYSDRPKLDYNVDVMEKFLRDFISAPDGPMKHFGEFWFSFIVVSNMVLHSYLNEFLKLIQEMI